MEKKHKVEALVGAIVLLIACSFVFFSYSSSWFSVQKTYMIKIRFERVDGLIAGGDVRMSGVKIGSIGHIRLDPKSYFAIVSCHIHPSVLIPKDSLAEVTSDSLMGNKSLSIIPGISEKTLKHGNLLVRSKSATNLESLISRFIFSSSPQNQG